jgi:hypothetical protein
MTAHGVRRRRRLAVGVAHDVEVEAARARRVVGGVPTDRQDHVQPARPRGHDEGPRAQRLQEADEATGRPAPGGEVAVGRVEVEDDAVGRLEVGHPCRPAVDRDDRLIGQEGEGGAVAAGDVHARAAVRTGLGAWRLDGAREVRHVVLAVLLHEAAAVDAVREALDGERAALELGQQQVGDVEVAVDEVGLGDPVVREQHLVGPRRFHRVALEVPPRAHEGHDRTTSRAGLSSRTPR